MANDSNNLPESFHVGVDLGQSRDPTAVALVARRAMPATRDAATWEWITEYEYPVIGLRRLPLGLSYPKIVAEIGALIERLPEHGTREIVVDATGVGAAVVDLMREQLRSLAIPIVPVIFTGGDTARCENGVWRVPKKDLIHALLVAFQEDRLRLPKMHELAETLINELKNMAIKIGNQEHVGYEAWRQNEHDDMVFALAMGVWRARKFIARPLGERRPLLW